MKIKKTRAYYGYSQEVFAQLLGIKRSTLANYEAGVSPIPRAISAKLSQLFDVESALAHDRNKAHGIVAKLSK